MREVITDLQSSDTWKIQLTIAISFISSKDTEKQHVIHSTSNNIKFSPYTDANEVDNELFESFRSKYPDNLETSVTRTDFIFDSVQLMHYKCHKVRFKRGGSYIDSLDWIKNKKATINPKNEDDKFYQFAATVALNYEKIEPHPKRVSNIKLFINKYTLEGINYPSKIDDFKKFEKNYPSISLNILYIKEKEIFPGYT